VASSAADEGGKVAANDEGAIIVDHRLHVLAHATWSW
jgi:hypothetical protein